MEKVTDAIEKGTTMLFTALTRKRAAPTVDAANVSAAATATSDGPGTIGKPLWDAIIQSVLRHSTIENRKEHIVCVFGQVRVQCPDFFNACEEHQNAVVVGARDGSDNLPTTETILDSNQVVDYELMFRP
eukprot:5616722-Pyramimonas_sp.AAC.1